MEEEKSTSVRNFQGDLFRKKRDCIFTGPFPSSKDPFPIVESSRMKSETRANQDESTKYDESRNTECNK